MRFYHINIWSTFVLWAITEIVWLIFITISTFTSISLSGCLTYIHHTLAFHHIDSSRSTISLLLQLGCSPKSGTSKQCLRLHLSNMTQSIINLRTSCPELLCSLYLKLVLCRQTDSANYYSTLWNKHAYLFIKHVNNSKKIISLWTL